MAVTSKRVIVTGQVQGVFFRDTCRQTAAAHGVYGWVRNLPDGSVEALFEGEPDAVDVLVAWAHEGPPAAFVDDVRVTEQEPRGHSTFEVRTTALSSRGRHR
ncbi:acylphosphatase [Streptomyces spirodelae]|uniref:Acylphosphatase n=1 Tax=Streptomyces spirodelae TaxID=2812904 RepID=A0ABS3WQL9_9ACTN|nr:acylphosphatase [Streptomyces spirodelae]MBO8185419.1 acylphosphatase [Streptomyces spirodelae]